jgi:hypothetical protein
MEEGLAVPSLRTYARAVSVALAVVGAAALSGVVKAAHGSGVVYLFTGTLFAYAGFWHRDARVVRNLVGGLGVLYLLYGLVMAVLFLAWGFPYEGKGFVQSLANAAFGGLSVLLAGVWSGEDKNLRDRREK